MTEFLKNNYSLITFLVEFAAAAIGLTVYRKFKNTIVKYFIWFLVAIVFIERIGDYPRILKSLDHFDIIYGTRFEKNYWWFTIFWDIGSAVFYSWYFQKAISIKLYSRMIYFCRVVFIFLALISIILDWDLFFINNIRIIDVSGSILIVFSSILFLIELLNSDKILDFYRSMSFYISGTVFIWFLITSVLVFYDVYFSKSDWNFVILKWQIHLTANIFMYSIFIFALIWCRPQND